MWKKQTKKKKSHDLEDTTAFVPRITPGGGNGMSLMAGNASAWTQSFKIRQIPGQSKEIETDTDAVDDLLDDLDVELLNPAVDQHAWNSVWYKERASNHAAVDALKGKSDGAFVIRDSSSQPGSFALSYRYESQTHHTLIHGSNGGLQLAKSPMVFPCLSDFVYHYSQPWTPDNTDLPCSLSPNVLEDESSDKDKLESNGSADENVVT